MQHNEGSLEAVLAELAAVLILVPLAHFCRTQSGPNVRGASEEATTSKSEGRIPNKEWESKFKSAHLFFVKVSASA